MSVPVVPAVPVKTALGQEELRCRSPGLGQRHRTVLFIVDGRRVLSEVLSLAQQAGAGTQHFEDLVRLGMVELPPVPEPEPLAEPARETTVEPGPEPTLEWAPPNERDPAVRQPQALLVLPAEALVPAPAPRPRLPRAPPVHDPSDDELLEQVRQLLLDTQRHDRVALRSTVPAQLRAATTLAQMIALAWQIQNELDVTRRSREGAICLERARELLGMGNTLVAEDTRPGGEA